MSNDIRKLGYKVHKTRFPELGYYKLHSGGWRFVNLHDGGAPTGPEYASKAELLASVEEFAAQFGCSGAKTSVNMQRSPQTANVYTVGDSLVWLVIVYNKNGNRGWSKSAAGRGAALIEAARLAGISVANQYAKDFDVYLVPPSSRVDDDGAICWKSAEGPRVWVEKVRGGNPQPLT